MESSSQDLVIVTGDLNDDEFEEPIALLKSKLTSALSHCLGEEKDKMTTFFYREREGGYIRR